MKNLNAFVYQLTLMIVLGFCLSCKKYQDPGPERSAIAGNAQKTQPDVITVLSPTEHTFTDVKICYDGKVFLLEDGKLKRLNGTVLEDIKLPASVYTDFKPKYLAISKDFTFYLRADNGIKVIKNLQVIHHYKVGAPPLQDFTPQTFGNLEIGVDETDQSIIFGIVRGGFDPILFSLAKITKNGVFGKLLTQLSDDVTATFITTFGIGGSPGTLWVSGLGAFGNGYYSQLFKFRVSDTPFDYPIKAAYGNMPGNHVFFPYTGAIDSVAFNVIGGIEVSKDGKKVFLKTGGYGYDGNPGDPNVSGFGNLLKVENNQVELLAENIENKRMAISNDGKTLYLAGKGLLKINF